MSNGSKTIGALAAPSVTVSFGERFTRSEQFNAIFKEGMELVERAAEYLDGEGRIAAKNLEPLVSVSYATESMRLTSRLLELASWLLIRRALKNGEISPEEAARKRARIRLAPDGRPSHIKRFEQLPAGLRGLIEASFLLRDRIAQIDRATIPAGEASAHSGINPVAVQLERLEAAFPAQPGALD